MKNTLFVIITTFCLLSCKQDPLQLNKIEANQLITDSTTANNKLIDSFIAPYSQHLNNQLDETLAYTAADLTKSDAKLESSLGNLMADISFEQADPIFFKRNQKHIDFMLLNHGGIRAPIPKGNITARNAFEVMPFENELVVVELTGEKTEDLFEYLSEAMKAHPISNQLKFEAEQDGDDFKAKINGESFDEDKNYYVLTTDYLQQGGDRMTFFSNPVNLYKLDYKLRNAMIDYFKKIDSIQPTLDQRFTAYEN